MMRQGESGAKRSASSFQLDQEGRRGHDQGREAFQPAFPPQRIQPCDGLKGFPQPHVVRQAGAEAPFRNPVQEGKALFLVRAHQCVQPGRKLRHGDGNLTRQDIQSLPEIPARFHHAVFIRVPGAAQAGRKGR